MTTIDSLNQQFGLSSSLEFVFGEGGLPFAQINNASASAVISLYGGQVLSYVPTGGEDLMFMGGKAYFVEGKAIKGGVPVCWPWFGADPEGKGRAAHGFARNSMWQVFSTEAISDSETQITVGMVDDDNSRNIWPNAFKMSLQITIGKSLKLALTTENTGDQPFHITQALHTYFSVGDISKTKILGLEDCKYLDKSAAGQGATKVQQDAIEIAGEVDRIYLAVPPDLMIEDMAKQRTIKIHSAGNSTAVVWNPWAKIAADMADLHDDDYLRFVCVETTNAADDVVEIQQGESYTLNAEYSL